MNPIIQTERLLLRPPEAGDLASIVAGVGDYEVAKNLAAVPHPYTEDDARTLLARTAERREQGDIVLGITLKNGGAYIGGCGAHVRGPGLFELGYWLARPHWGQGYATEAARAVIAHAFAELGAESLVACWIEGNPASGRVLDKLGFHPAGTSLRDCLARKARVFCHDMLLEKAQVSRLHDEKLTA